MAATPSTMLPLGADLPPFSLSDPDGVDVVHRRTRRAPRHWSWPSSAPTART